MSGEITPVLVDAAHLRERVRSRVISELTKSFPLDLRGRTLALSDVRVLEKDYSPAEQKRALMTDDSLTETVKGTLSLIDANGKTVDTQKNFTLTHLPWFSERHTIIMDGNEYQVANMLRRRPGVYTQRSANGELHTTFNLSKGANFNVTIDPAKAAFYMVYDSTNIPLYPVLRALGVSHANIAASLGESIANENMKLFGEKQELAVNKLYQKLAHESVFNAKASYAEKLAEIEKKLGATAMDPHVTNITLGVAHTKVTPEALLAAARKLLRVHDGHEQVDDSDSLAFKTFHSVDDFLGERIKLTTREWTPKARGALNGKNEIRGNLKPAPFSASMRKFITNSALTAVPTGINPIELIDHSVKVTALGEGGIPSERAIPFETRLTHPTHFGVLDPIRTPECLRGSAETLTKTGWKRWDQVTMKDLLACRINGRLEFHKPLKLHVGPYSGPLHGVKSEKLSYLVTPNHRVYCAPLDRVYPRRGTPEFSFYTAKDAHNKPRVFDTAHDPYIGSDKATFQLPHIHGYKSNVGPINMEDWASFIGWFLSEGCVGSFRNGRAYSTHISQSKDANPYKCARIEALLDRLPFKWSYSGSDYVIHHKQLAAYLQPFGYCYDKLIPEEMLNLSVQARTNLLETLLLGDGRVHCKRATGKTYKQRVFCTTSEYLARDVERLVISLGLPVRTRRYQDNREDRYLDTYEVRILRDRYRQAVPRKGHYYTEQYSGLVYCATVPGGLLFVREGDSCGHWTGNSGHAGVDIRATIAAHRDEEGNLYTPLMNTKTNEVEFIRAGDLGKHVVAFPHQELKGDVDVFHNGQVKKAPASTVTYQQIHDSHTYSPATSLIPMLRSIQGNRAIMGSKMQTQWLPLVHREVPLVQVAHPYGSSFEDFYGHMIVPLSPVNGTVEKIEDGYVYIRPHKEKRSAEIHSVKKGENRPVVFTKMLGPHTFNIEIAKNVRHLGDGQAKAKGSSEDYGHLPGYVGPDGDALDFFVGNDPKGSIFSYEKQKRYDSPDWRTTDMKYVVGLNAADEAAFHKNCEEWNTDKVRFANLRRFKDWNDLQQHIDTHHKPSEKEASDAGLIKVPYQDNFPMPSKTRLHHEISVKVGDKVEMGQRLGDSNFTRDGVLASGINARIAYMPYFGHNSNDAVVISSGFADKLTSEHMYREVYKSSGVEISKAKHKVYFSAKYQPTQYSKLDDEGVVKKGAVVSQHDLLVAGITKTQLMGADAMLGKISKSLTKPYREAVLTWEHNSPGEVVDVIRTDGQIAILLKTQERMQVGDKLCYDEQTEMLTDTGWKPVQKVSISDKVLSLLSPTDPSLYDYVYPSAVHQYRTGDAMCCVLTEDVDLLVTAQHNMYSALHAQWGLHKAARLASEDAPPTTYCNCEREFVVPPSAYTLSEKYDRMVFGVTVPSGVVYVRRNGKPVWSGNSNRYGGKGVVSKIVPDHEMLKDESGKPIELIMTSAGVVSRINPAQLHEALAGKVAEKMGKPILFDNASSENTIDWVENLAKKHNVKSHEQLYDPTHDRTIKGPDGQGVFVGRSMIFKLFKTTDTNFAGHGVGVYDINEQPLKSGGDEGAKGLGKMEVDALVAHNARGILSDAVNIRGQKNDQFWRSIQLGQTLMPTYRTSFAFNKFKSMMEGAGVKVDKRGSKFHLLPMTDADVLARSAGEVKNNKTLIAKNLKPEAGGLFDMRTTGGPQGTLYSHISLHEPVPNPVFEEPVRRLLGMTEKKLNETIRDKGGAHIRDELKRIDVKQKLTELETKVKTAKGSELNDTVKQIKYLRALEAEGLKPHEAYVLTKIPVVPPVFRPISQQKDNPSQLMVADANKLYAHLMDVNEIAANPVLQSDVPKHREALYNAVSAVFGTDEVDNQELQGQNVKGFLTQISGQGSPKGGFFQRKLMKRQQDVSGRGTAVPDTNLHMDAVGLPEQMLWQMLDKLIVARLIRKDYSALHARQMVNDKAPAARQALMEEIRERPMLINRAPTLHRYGIVAAYATPVQGSTIRVSPFIEKGLNLDYDGDDVNSAILLKISEFTWNDLLDEGHVLGSYHKDEAHVTARFREYAGYRTGDKFAFCNLADFPHSEVVGRKDHRTFYKVPQGLEVLAYDEQTGCVAFRPVTVWSKHENVEVEIVNLASERQMVTDDDPRAVYGVDGETLLYKRACPKDAIGMFVPIGADMSTLKEDVKDVPFPRYKHNNARQMQPSLPLTEASGRALGALVGDGWVVQCKDKNDKMNIWGVALSSLDETVASNLEASINTWFEEPVHMSRQDRLGGDFGPDVRSVKYTICSIPLGLFVFDMIGKGAKNKHLPPFFLTAPRAFRLGLLAGLIDTNGSIATSNAKTRPQIMVNYTSVSLRLCQELVWLAKSLSVHASISATSTPKDGPCWQVTFSTPELHRLQGMPCSHAEKKARFASFFAGASPRDDLGGHTRNDTVPLPSLLGKQLQKLYPQEMKKLKRAKNPIVGDEADRIRANASMNQLLWRATKEGFVSRHTARRVLVEHSSLRESADPLVQRWIALVDNTNIRWDRVVSFEKTGIKEDGYDLTVPGYETFMNVEGVILSNTLQVHAPITAQGIEDAKRMTMSNLLLSDQAPNKLLAFPQHESIIGVTHALKVDQVGTKVKVFNSREEVLKAWRKGDIKLSDPIEVRTEKKASEEDEETYISWLSNSLSSDTLSFFPPEYVCGEPEDPGL